MSESLREVMLGHAKAVGVEPGELDDAALQTAIIDKIDSLDDAQWKKLPKATIEWSNAILAAEQGKQTTAAAAATTVGAKVGAKKETKAEATTKMVAVKKAAKEKAADVKHTAGGRVFNEGSSSFQIYKLVKDAGDAGITADEAVEAAKKAGIKSTNIDARVRDILKMSSVMKNLTCSGIMKFDGKKYVATSDADLAALRASAPAAEPKKPAKTKAAEPAAPAAPAEPAAPAAPAEPAGKALKTKPVPPKKAPAPAKPPKPGKIS